MSADIYKELVDAGAPELPDNIYYKIAFKEFAYNDTVARYALYIMRKTNFVNMADSMLAFNWVDVTQKDNPADKFARVAIDLKKDSDRKEKLLLSQRFVGNHP